MFVGFDPFTAAYERIWHLLNTHTGFTSLVKLGNRIDLASIDRVAEREMQAADTPEVVLGLGRFEFDAYGGSNNRDAVFSQSYTMFVTHPDMNVVPIGRLKWETMIALTKGGPRLGITAPDGGQICDRWLIQDAGDTPDDLVRSRGQHRFVTVLRIVVHMRYPIALMIA